MPEGDVSNALIKTFYFMFFSSKNSQTITWKANRLAVSGLWREGFVRDGDRCESFPMKSG